MNSTGKKILIVLLGIAVNVLGKILARGLNLPIWFDMVGTILSAYYVGIWGGVVTGLCTNVCFVIFFSFDQKALVYALVSVTAAFIMYDFIKRGYLNNPLKAVVSSFWLGIICTVVSTPLNLLFFNGYVGNEWGDTFVDMLRWYDASHTVSALAGEAIVEIVDKQVCVMVSFFAIYMIGRGTQKRKKQVEKAALILAFALLLSQMVHPLVLKAGEKNWNRGDFVGTIYNNTNGMVSSEANDICETEDGIIWIGSYAGLTKYDGNEFEFVREGRLVNVAKMITDSKGRLWIGTNDAGIARYEDGKYTYFTEKDGLPSNSIRCFAEDSEGNIYVGTSDKICIFHPDDTVEILKEDITFAKEMTVQNDILIVLDNNGKIYALDRKEQLPIAGDVPRDLFYYCLATTSRGLLVGTETGELFAFHVSRNGISLSDTINLSAKLVSSVFEDSQKRIWIATDSGLGYLRVDGKYTSMHYDGFDSSIVCFYEDYQGNIWAASSYYGVMKLSESSFVNLFDKAGIDKRYVNAVIRYQEDFYCGTDEGVVVLDGRTLQPKTNEFTKRIDKSRVRCLYTDSKDRLWACTYSGLFCYDGNNKTSCYNMKTHPITSERFRCMTEKKDGTIVAGTADGINYIKDGKVIRTITAKDGLANTQILSIVEDADGTIWAGSDGSGIYVISEDRTIRKYTVEDGLSSNIVLRIIPYQEGYFVVTSNSLCYIDSAGKIRKLSHFPYFNNFDIMIQNDMAYITCSAGLYETKASELCKDSATKLKCYSADEGLVSGLTANSWNYISDSRRLYLCSNNGVIVFDENADKEEGNIKFGIVSAESDGTSINLSGKKDITVPSDTQNLSLYASVKNFTFADVKVRFFVKELEENPKVCSWDEMEPIKIYKPDSSEYHVCLQILDDTGENVLHEKIYKLSKTEKKWEKPLFQTYLVVVCIEIFLFTIISIVGMILFVVRKNELEKLQVKLEQKVDEQTKEIRERQQSVKELFIQTIAALSEAVDAKDRYTSGHSKRVAEYARMIAGRMGKSKEEQDEIYRAGLLHDVGKIRIPIDIINKPGRLTDEEFNIIKIHPVTGYHILRGISGGTQIAVAAKHHHERYDGKGYPNGLSGEKIPEYARILGVADAYDAMTSNRSYRKALPQEVVYEEIEKGKGTQFDPDVADVMLQMIDEDKGYQMQQMDFTEKRILTVDDEPINHKIITHIMKDEPMYQVVAAGSGKEALKMMEKEPFDLILLDFKMPEMDGVETLRLIRKKYQTPVVLVTSDKTLDLSAEIAELGCDDYITKPFLPLLVKEVVHNMTEKIEIEE